MMKHRISGRTVKQEGFALIFAILMLSTLTVMGLAISDMAVMETNIVSSDYCLELARARAWSCTQMFMQAVASQKMPSLKLKNLDSNGSGGTPDTDTVECLVPGMITKGGAEFEGEGGAKIGKLTADLFSTDYSFQMIVFKSIGFAGKGCGQNFYDEDNDIFNALTSAETANGIMFEQEVGVTYGPCKGNSGC